MTEAEEVAASFAKARVEIENDRLATIIAQIRETSDQYAAELADIRKILDIHGIACDGGTGGDGQPHNWTLAERVDIAVRALDEAEDEAGSLREAGVRRQK
jgi:hypothetical protein